jgi:hypothetical protein
MNMGHQVLHTTVYRQDQVFMLSTPINIQGFSVEVL